MAHSLGNLEPLAPKQTVEEELKTPSVRRVGVLVLGMHRSGSSAITRIFSLLGCSLPNSPMILAFDNPRGHWESQLIADFNDEILTLANTHWDDWLPVNPRLSESLVWQELIDRGREVLRAEYDDADLFVLKDPRICKLAGFWQEVMAAEGIDPTFVIQLRNPIEVARSLAARNGLDEYQCLLIWLRHVLAAEAATRGKARVFTEYAALLDNWEPVAAHVANCLGIDWPRASPASALEISQFLSVDLRHHISETAALTENPAISPWLYRAYHVLIGWARTGENAADYPILDGLLQAFDDAGIAFAQPMLNGAQAAYRAARVETELAAAGEQRDRVESQLSVALTERDVASAQVGDLSEKLVASGEQQQQLSQEIARQKAYLQMTEYQLNESFGEVARLGQSILQMETDSARAHAELQSVRDCTKAEAKNHTDLIGALTLQLHLARKRSDDNSAEAARLSSSLLGLRTEAARLNQVAAEQEAALTVAAAKTVWLQKVTALRSNQPGWWTLMPDKWLQQRHHRRLLRRGLFDAAGYLERNPDVAASGMDPVLHYALHGIDEARPQ